MVVADKRRESSKGFVKQGEVDVVGGKTGGGCGR